MNERIVNTKMVSDFPNIMKLVEKHGITEASHLLGLTNLGKMIKEGKTRPAYEMAAEFVLTKENGQTLCDDSYVVKVPSDKKIAVTGLFEAMELEYMSISF